ncbi:hypothetical protein ACFV3R_11375 [Streptomyces sp. NPDC059740]|uniref:hypothetical protein n=1 Tax=Streptomyces sp. NPDC059740 TaxID=3346926 RepID=UPI003648461C
MILVEIADDPNETALAEELFALRGWPERPAEEHERAGCPPERVARVVEVRLTGARKVLSSGRLAWSTGSRWRRR